MIHRLARLTLAFLLSGAVPAADAGEWSGYIGGEWLGFARTPLSPAQHMNYLSFVAQPEYHHKWNDRRQSVHFVPYLRIDEHDSERTHFDLRELNYIHVGSDWEVMAGIGKVFWGVTESAHLVDIINQTDLVENVDGEDKLGQPMINLTLLRDWGSLDLFVLPGFRERTFAGAEGRPGVGLPVDTDHPVYESAARDRHVDFAIRWSHSIGDWDVGLSHFYGTAREPRLLPVVDGLGVPVKLTPFYEIIDQTGLAVQATTGDWLWKLEAITRGGQGDRFFTAAGGFEYTFVGVMESAVDVGILAEYLYDSRGDGTPSPFDDDVVVGTRITLNDVQSTELLAGVVLDMEDSAATFNIEASRRIGANWKASLEIRSGFFVRREDPLYANRRDSHARLELARYF